MARDGLDAGAMLTAGMVAHGTDIRAGAGLTMDAAIMAGQAMAIAVLPMVMVTFTVTPMAMPTAQFMPEAGSTVAADAGKHFIRGKGDGWQPRAAGRFSLCDRS